MSRLTEAPRLAGDGDSANVVDWVAVVAGALGALMATLDTSITNTALPQIQGEIGASGTEGTWIGTGYLVAEVVMIPLAAWLTRLLGLRRLLLVTTVAFVLFSMLCGISDGLVQMVIGRSDKAFLVARSSQRRRSSSAPVCRRVRWPSA
jgi:DHA2 family multidrug resistance protein